MSRSGIARSSFGPPSSLLVSAGAVVLVSAGAVVVVIDAPLSSLALASPLANGSLCGSSPHASNIAPSSKPLSRIESTPDARVPTLARDGQPGHRELTDVLQGM